MSVENETGQESDWWEGALEEDTTWSLPLEGEGGLWSSGFLPPPPRPPFLDEHIDSDGLTTCDLCTWARAPEPGSHSSYGSPSDLPGTLTWTISLVIVSLLSALLGAALMVTLMHCRRSQDEEPRLFRCLRRRRRVGEENHQPNLEGDKELVTLQSGVGNGGGVWGWLTRRTPVVPPAPTVPAVNHYTMDEGYAAVGEALYAELDRPAYQNTGYVSDADPVSSAPSSAYYSDLSNSDRTYEAVGAQTAAGIGLWDVTETPLRRQGTRLSSITETLSVPSDYV
ncbi:uncharacterized protein LOC124359953 [Homalodisca vitripennis]|uniref:uncharacterized protein LOC124359953 n=1 Tax=Homalodisca vitripennis TaxID=197043 RepID=UPI001EEC38D2|nr:uncharacterized protein LOC124359953 [Homalodisca vitripennis]